MSGPLTPLPDDDLNTGSQSFYASRSPPSVRQSSSSWGETSPWGAPPPSAAAPTLPSSSGFQLNDQEVPPSYRTRWEALEPIQDAISLAALRGVLSSGGIKSSAIDQILSLTVTSPRITRTTFYTSLALLALAQLHRELSLEAVREAAREGGLLVPTLPSVSSAGGSTMTTSYDPPSYVRSESAGDAWGSLAGGGGGSGFGATSQPKTNGHSSTPSLSYPTTTSNGFSNSLPSSSSPPHDEEPHDRLPEPAEGLGYDPTTEGWALGRQKTVEVQMRDELEGMLGWRHNTWFVACEQGPTVQRRYSDFTWLLTCLTKRYPFRMLPSLPPKRVQIAGNYLATDDLFLERRRMGLKRFLGFCVNHPVLKEDGLVKVFLEEQEDLSTYRSRTSITLEEESLSRVLTPSEEMSIPSDLSTKLTSFHSRLPSLIEHWTRITSIADRLAHRRLNQGGEYLKMGEALKGAVEVEQGGWRTVEVEEVEREEGLVGQGVERVGGRERDSARRMLDSTVEELKRHRELYTNFRDLFARQVALSPDAVDKLKRRVESNLKKLSTLRDSPPTPATTTQFDVLSTQISIDQRSIATLLNRRVFIRYCMWQELLFLFRSTSLVKPLVREWVSQEERAAKGLVGVWEELGSALGE
ncbi:hypothetical protein BCR35DRAFT_298091 [Leucosporidium creatinivorum]|uniref:Sorting nexin MVP1 n=1 Tax=Leucosporidium creatinivorum TaxID=106004 RepID=A0A1Y2G3V6_9BASI|nr:hypothetical protein BCR35DRAFT_298091 [Leucosporidium creatinivorum]